MATSAESAAPSFLRDAFKSHANFSSSQRQDAQKRALKWLQLHIETDLSDETILKKFTQMWRSEANSSQDAEQSPLHFENLPGSYKGTKSINSHQEDALSFIQAAVPLKMQEDFSQRWDAKTKLEVSNSSGACFKIDRQEIAVLQQKDPDGDGTAWYQVDDKQIYYLLSSEPAGDDFLIVLSEEISPQNKSTWFVAQEHVKIANI
ncbi:hypothetical protein IQ254_03255 [Nodosilinea sp. LEGE 07088]|uniref:hypothetical protein n=1 Tax=Nodosilinea sp. LEGE 07088 TaxID=2777968 RepID=UPI00187DE2FC|nr:hypothetical protein [Nodosilinea sp. LEGE 07088]MBE9136228.1 hypothetical protein [Nodosilinea sp. LEGE 07088]